MSASTPAAPAPWRRKVGEADPETRKRMLVEALKSHAPADYSEPAPVRKPAPRGGSNLRIEKALRDAGA